MTVEQALTIVETLLKPQTLSKVQQLVFCQCWEGRTYGDIAAKYDYDTDYIKYVGFQLWQLLSQALGKKVTKSNISSVLESIPSLAVDANSYTSSSNFDNGIMQFELLSLDVTKVTQKAATIEQHPGWAEAMDVPVFYDRCTEMLTLKQWLVQERCRLVALFGIGGIGKTSLAAILGQQVQHEFQHLIWRSLRNLQPLTDMVADLFQSLFEEQKNELPTTPEASISLLVNYLRQHRCLLVLDNSEGILRSGDHFGRYIEGYEHYGQLLREIADTYHQSCVVLTGREKPIGFGFKEGTNLPVRSLQLTGLPEVDAYKIIEVKGLKGSQEEMRSLSQHYLGNPLALKIVASYIRDLFNGDISEFLAQGITVFGDIRNLLDQQFNRLSETERQIMYWLAINTEPVSILQLQEELIPIACKASLLEALLSLERRSLIENNTTRFSVPPIFKEYMGIVFQTKTA